MAGSGDDAAGAAGILADRLAASLVQHEPGWRLPRPSTLARRYHVPPAQVEQAVSDLAARDLVRMLPDGQAYRASPAHYLIPVAGVPRLSALADPMGSEVACGGRRVTWRQAPDGIGRALGVRATEQVCAVRCHWRLNGKPAAISTTYLTERAARLLGDVFGQPAGGGPPACGAPPGGVPGVPAPLGIPAALHLETHPPPSSLARWLRLASGQPAAMITVRYDEAESGRPAALTVTALRTELFRIVIETGGGVPGGFPAADRVPAAGTG